MTEETLEKILKPLYRTWRQVGEMMGLEEYSHAEGMQTFRSLIRDGGPPTAQFFVSLGAKVIPEAATRASLEPNKLDEILALIDTEEKFEAWLIAKPEPNKDELDFILKTVKEVLPNLKTLFVQAVKNFPKQHAGGRPRELPDPAVRHKIREQLKIRREPGTRLADLYESLANEYHVSPTTIKRIRFEEDDEGNGELAGNKSS